MQRLRFSMPTVALGWADCGYADGGVNFARRVLADPSTSPANRTGPRTFEVLSRCWVVERTPSCISRCCRLHYDNDRLPEHSEATVDWAMIGL